MFTYFNIEIDCETALLMLVFEICEIVLWIIMLKFKEKSNIIGSFRMRYIFSLENAEEYDTYHTISEQFKEKLSAYQSVLQTKCKLVDLPMN